MRYIDAEKIKITADTMIADGECYVPLLAVKQAIARTPIEDVEEIRHGSWILPQKKDSLHMMKWHIKNALNAEKLHSWQKQSTVK